MESEMNKPAGLQSSAAPGAMNQGSEVFNQAKRTISQAYNKSARAVGDTYDQAVTFGRRNPGKTACIAFGIGVGVGILLLSPKRNKRLRRYGEPIVNVVSSIAREFIRTL